MLPIGQLLSKNGIGGYIGLIEALPRSPFAPGMDGGSNVFATFLPPSSSIKNLEGEPEPGTGLVRMALPYFREPARGFASQHPGIIEPVPWAADGSIRLRPDVEAVQGLDHKGYVSSPLGSEQHSTFTTQSLSPHAPTAHRPAPPGAYPPGGAIPEHRALTRFPEYAGAPLPPPPYPAAGLVTWPYHREMAPGVYGELPPPPPPLHHGMPPPIHIQRMWPGPIFHQVPPTIVDSNFEQLRSHMAAAAAANAGREPQRAWFAGAVIGVRSQNCFRVTR